MKKKVLLWAPKFFGYEVQIYEELKTRGFEVEFIEDRPYKNTFLRWLISAFPVLAKVGARFIAREQFVKLNQHYDVVLVVNGQTLDLKNLRILEDYNPAIRKILYMWDSIDNRKNSLRLSSEFDKVLSFDQLDCKHYGFLYRPLFFSPVYVASKNAAQDRRHSLVFVGTVHSDRLSVISKVLRSVVNSHAIMYLQGKWVFYVKCLLSSAYRQRSVTDFQYTPITHSEIVKLYSQSMAVLDIQHPRQSGLTMRTLEVLASGCKLITTNERIRSEPFYTNDRVLVIDRQNPVIPHTFLNKELEPLPNSILHQYSLEGFLDEVFS